MELREARFLPTVHIKLKAMKIKLNRALWNHKKDELIEASDNSGNWAVKKGYADFIPEPIEPISEAKVVTEYETKVIAPEQKKRGRKAK